MNPLFTSRPFPEVPGVEVTHRYIDIGKVKIHVAEAGSGQPLLMCHGWPQHWWMWRKQIPFFAPYYRVIVPDMRGFGWSEVTNDGYLKDELAEDLKKLIDALGYTNVRLLSHDWGGWVGFIVCGKYPGLISQHFATNICPIWPKLSLQMIPATLQLNYMFRIAMPYFGQKMLMAGDRFVRYMFDRDRTTVEPIPDAEIKIFSDQFKEPERAKASVKLYRLFLLLEYIPLGLMGKYKNLFVTTPSRILFGQDDGAIALSWLRGYEKNTNDLQIEIVPHTGHFIIDERPDMVNEKAYAFFTDPKYN